MSTKHMVDKPKEKYKHEYAHLIWVALEKSFHTNIVFAGEFNRHAAWDKMYYNLSWKDEKPKLKIIVKYKKSQELLELQIYTFKQRDLYNRLLSAKQAIEEFIGRPLSESDSTERTKFLFYQRSGVESRCDSEYLDELVSWIQSQALLLKSAIYKCLYGIDLNIYDPNAKVKELEEELTQLPLQGSVRDAVVKVRINQDIFRDRLIMRYRSCCLCGLSVPGLLIASHIKPWSKSEPDEKLDIDNGFLMCPNHDKLFDQGWISFDDSGKIIISSQLSQSDYLLTNIHGGMTIRLTEQNKKYLKYHRDNMLK